MNIREFCREPGYGGAVLLTWSFDAVFFERVVLQDLEFGETRVPLIVGDRRQITAAVDRWPDHVQSLGRRYVLDTAAPSGDFHPKLILRIGRKGGLIWLSTGNVSAAGFGGNRELATVWRVGPEEPDAGAWIGRLLEQIDKWCSGPAASDILNRLRSETWITEASTQAPPAAFLAWTRSGATLAQQLEERWRGRRFDELYVTTGSTDQSGDFLAWAHRIFGVRRAVVAVHASSATFDVARIERLPIEVLFIEPTGSKSLHAKSYWFEGVDGAAAIFGSANCSASAWLRPVEAGGNIEVVAIFDHAERANWHHVLAEFEGKRLTPREHLRERLAIVEASDDPAPFHLLSVESDALEGYVRVKVEPAVPKGARVTLLLGDEATLLRETTDYRGISWVGLLPERSGTSQVLFASVRIETDTIVMTTSSRWVDQKHDLQQANRDRRAASALNRFSLALETGEHRRVLEDLQLAMDTVLSDRARFPDMPLRRRLTSEHDEDKTRGRLDPRRVAVALGERVVANLQHGMNDQDFPMTFSGVLQAFFPDPAEDPIPTEDASDVGGEEGDGRLAPVPKPEPTTRTRPADQLQRRLVGKMDSYLTRLRDPRFANTCTATQLVDAVAFPMAIATLGTGSGWVDSDHAREWAVSAVSSLLHERIPDSSYEGLLAHVAARYASEGITETFDRVVGNGLLWTVSAAVLAGLKWNTLGERVQRVLLLRDVFHRRELVASTEIDALSHAAGRLRQRDAVRTMTEELPLVDDALREFESWLTTHFERLVAEQAEALKAHERNDPLWRPNIGWVFVDKVEFPNVRIRPWQPRKLLPGIEIKRVRATGFYVNVRMALESSQGTAPQFP